MTIGAMRSTIRRNRRTASLIAPYELRLTGLDYVPAESAPADFCAVHEPCRRGAGRLPAVSRQQPARDVRSAGHADPPDAAGESESVCEAKAWQTMTLLLTVPSPRLRGEGNADGAAIPDWVRGAISTFGASESPPHPVRKC
jgi:hypothetical protein